MTKQAISKAIKSGKPAVIKEHGNPRYVVLDWKTYRAWEELRDEMDGSARLNEALRDPKNQRRIKYNNKF